MNIQKYQAFITVVEQGSLTKAAEELGCTQSAVSHSISGLEEELGGVEGAGGEERADLRRHDDDGLGRRGECPLELETKLKPFGSVTSYIPQES